MLNTLVQKMVAGVVATLLYGAGAAIATEIAPRAAAPVALLLPLQSPAFARLAESVRQGVLAAAKSDPNALLAITTYPITDDPNSTLAAYEQALAEGNRLIIGPLTRDGVSRIVPHVRSGVPVLALNSLDDNPPLPDGLYAFSLQVETEARQVARMAFADGRRSALTLAGSSGLARRMHAAFAGEFERQGGKVVAQFAYSTSTADLLAVREATKETQIDAVFLALNAERARLVRPYVNGPAQIYATSQVFDGPVEPLRNAELNGIRFVDMPWLLQPDHPAVMVYARPDTPTPTASDGERLYAFGIDAYRLAADLAGPLQLAREPLDGVTGRITLTKERYFVRELTPAQFADGRPTPVSTRY